MFRFSPAVFALALMAPTWCPAAPIGLDQALELAAQRALTGRGSPAGARSAGEAVVAAGQLPDPVLNVGIDNLPITGPDRLRTTADSMTMRRLGISQEWVSPVKRALRKAAAQALVGREAASQQVAVSDARLQAALAYLDAYYAGETVKLTVLAEHHLHEEAEAARARLSSATGTSQEVLQMIAAGGIAQDESAEAEQLRASAITSLQRWVGLQPDALLAPSIPRALTEEAWVLAHPAVVQGQREVDIANAEASATAANRAPNWTWQAAYGQRTGFSDMAFIGVSIPLPVSPRDRQDRDTAAKLAAADKSQAALEDALRMAVAEYRSLAGDAKRLTLRVERYQASVMAPTAQRTQSALAGYRSNQLPLMTLFEARHAEVDAQRKQLNLQRDLAKIQAQLAFKPVSGGAS